MEFGSNEDCDNDSFHSAISSENEQNDTLHSPRDIISESAIQESMSLLRASANGDTGMGPGRIRKHANQGNHLYI